MFQQKIDVISIKAYLIRKPLEDFTLASVNHFSRVFLCQILSMYCEEFMSIFMHDT